MIKPDWKILTAFDCHKKRKTPKHKDVANLLSVINKTCKNTMAIKLVAEAFEVYKFDAMIKEIVEACLLCSDYTLADIEDITGVPEEVLDVYRVYFFDLSVFKYRLHKFSYVRDYENEDFPDAKLYKTWAVHTGINFFRWKFKAGNTQVVPKEVLTELVGDTFFRAKEHINEPITSNVTKESLKWLKQASDSITALQRVDTGGSRDKEILTQFRVAIEHKDLTNNDDDISDAEIV